MTDDMFFHVNDDSIAYDGYFNILSCKKWRRYTVVDTCFLVLEGTGNYEITIMSEKGRVCDPVMFEGTDRHRIPLPRMNAHDFIWFEWKADSDHANLKYAAYVTEQLPVCDVKLAADICTYKREEYVKRNLKVLRASILENERSPVYRKLDVFVVDNGQTLPTDEIETDKILLFPNINAGGSGGFTRGILEILKRKQDKGYTHMIFLDDDAVLMPDAFVRCYAILSYIKEEYKDCCVAGALIDEEVPYLQQESGAYYRNGQTIQAKASYDLRNRDTVVKNEEIEAVDYAGWWWACFPLTFVREDNLPLPFFIHFDDIEYSLRNNKEIIYLNGICVWHAAPQKHRGLSNSYYDIRNRLVTDALHDPGKSLGRIIRECVEEAAYNVLRYRYNVADMVLLAVEDFLKGPEEFTHIEPEKKNAHVRGMCDKLQPIAELTDDQVIKEQIHEYIEGLTGHKPVKYEISRKKYLLTLNGWIFPARREDKNRATYCNMYAEDLREMYRAKRALLVDPYLKKGIWVQRSYRGAIHSLWCVIKVWCLLLTKYRRSTHQYRKSGQYLTGENMWKEYLELDRE